MYLDHQPTDGNSHLLLNVTEDMCNPSEEANGFQLKSVLHSVVQQYTNIPIGCPVKAVSKNQTIWARKTFTWQRMITISFYDVHTHTHTNRHFYAVHFQMIDLNARGVVCALANW